MTNSHSFRFRVREWGNRKKVLPLEVIHNGYKSLRCKDISDFIRILMKKGKPVIVVTNSPFEFGSPSDFPTVINVYSGNHESLHAAAEVIFGE